MLKFIDPTESGAFDIDLNLNDWPNSRLRQFEFPQTDMFADSTSGNRRVRVHAGRTSPRRLTSFMALPTTGHHISLRTTFTEASVGKVVAGFHFEQSNQQNYTAIATSVFAQGIFRMGAAQANGNDNQTDLLYIRADGSLSLNGTNSAAGVIVVNTENFIEVEYDLSAGTTEVFVNNTSVLTGTTSLTEVDGFSLCNILRSTSTYSWARFDDIYVADDEGGSGDVTGRTGPIRVINVPLLAELSTNFTPQGGAASNLAAVQKSDITYTTYNQSGAANDVGDSFSVDISDIPAGAEVLGVNLMGYFKKTDSGERNAVLTSSDGVNSAEHSAGTIVSDLWKGNPITILRTAPDGTAWTDTKLADLEVGYKAKS